MKRMRLSLAGVVIGSILCGGVLPAVAVPAPSLARGALCLTFDDRNFDAWEANLPLFRKYGAHATFFAYGPIDARAEACLRRLAADGHSIGLHGFRHKKATALMQEVGEEGYLKDEILPQLSVCRAKGLPVHSFAYPYSARNARTDALLLKHFRRLRGGGKGSGPVPLAEALGKQVFIGLCATSPRDTPEQIAALLPALAASNAVLVAYAHDIEADGQAHDSHNITRADLEMLLAAAQRTGVAVIGFDELSSFEAMRTQMLNRPRSVIYNTDGNDMTLYPRALPLTPEAFESVRLKYTEGTKIDSVFYCPHSSAFGWFTTRKTHDFMTTQFRPPDAEVYNAAADFAEKGTDALEMAAAYCRRRGLEIFVSIRMNDTHDNRGPHPPSSHFSLFKQQHPECLMGTMTNRPRYCAWTAVDFAHEAVRAHVRRFVREFLENYDIDGIEYDYFRHLQLFKTVANGADATQAELDLMTGLMRDLRAIADEVGRKRGRPFLVAVRVPDSVGFCRVVGIDIERWVRESIVDIVIGSGYFQCNPWRVMADVVHAAGGKFYASLDEPRNVTKRAPLGMLPGRGIVVPFYRARTAAALAEGVDGVYFFNLEKERLSSIARLDPRHPGGEAQNYFAVPRATAFSQFWHYCADPMRFLNMPKIDPQRPLKFTAGETYAFDLVIGDDPAAYGPELRVTADVLTDAKDGASDVLALSVNGTALERTTCRKGLFSFSVPAKTVKKGANAIAITAAAPLRIADFALRIGNSHGKEK